MNKRNRVLTALDFEEPDRIPISEMDIDVPLMENITGKTFPSATSLQTQVITDIGLEKKRLDLKIECYDKVGFDMVTSDLSAPQDWKPEIASDGTMIDLWGRVLKLDKQSKAWVPFTSIFSTPESYNEFTLPDPYAPGWTFATEYTRSRVGEDVAVAAFIRDSFANAWEMFTPMQFVKLMYTNPSFIKNVIGDLTKFNIEIIKQLVEHDIDLVISGGDYCEEKGPMIPVEYFKKMIFPHLKKQADASKKYGIKFLKHTDGNILPLLRDLSTIVDGLHSLDPSAGVDIGAVKREYGENFILMGNVSVDNLATKNRLEIISETKECIKKASPGGGHILSSSNSWAAGARLENCLTMVETGRKYGVYPIEI